MSFLSSLGFGPSTPASIPAPQSSGTNNNSNMGFSAPAGGAAAPNPNPATLPGDNPNNQIPNEPQKTVDPFDKYKGMFDNKPDAESAPNFTLDDKMLGEAAGAQDFMKGINADLVQRATSGDTAALMQMMNEVGRNAYKSSLSHSGRLTESFVGAREGFQAKGFSSKVRGELTVNSLTGTPNFKNPVVREQLIRIANDLQKQHPDAAPGEIGDMAKDYITQLSNAINPQASEGKQSQTKEPTDFGSWFDNDQR